ncbi:hypothetical protein P0Y35_18485 [Kiritimatiellaeota bacterium B1221]|nr:hypothetical protein [Kiritimatiellaeota bacterium B1221]
MKTGRRISNLLKALVVDLFGSVLILLVVGLLIVGIGILPDRGLPWVGALFYAGLNLVCMVFLWKLSVSMKRGWQSKEGSKLAWLVFGGFLWMLTATFIGLLSYLIVDAISWEL